MKKIEKAEPAPIQSSALTPERAIEIHDSMFPRVEWERDKVMGNVAKYAKAIEREVLARLPKPTAQGTAARPNADCSGEPSNCPDNEGYGCACSQSPAQVTGEPASIDTPEFISLLLAWERGETGINGRAEEFHALVNHINRHIAAQATAGRDAVRLDFLGSPAVVSLHQYEPLEGEAYIAIDLDFPGSPTVRGATVREAIDAAITYNGQIAPHAAEQSSGGEHA